MFIFIRDIVIVQLVFTGIYIYINLLYAILIKTQCESSVFFLMFLNNPRICFEISLIYHFNTFQLNLRGLFSSSLFFFNCLE